MFNLPIRLIVAVSLAFILSGYFDRQSVAIFYSLSMILKDFLMLLLPFVVFSYLSSAVLSLQGKATFFIFAIFGLVIISNIVNVLTAYGIASVIFGHLSPIDLNLVNAKNSIEVLFGLPIKPILTADKAMILGFLVGMIGNFTQSKGVPKVVQLIKKVTTKILNVVFIPLLPAYVFGFVLKIGYEGGLGTLATAYAPVFFLSFFCTQAYLFFWYAVGCGGDLKSTISAIRNMAPAWITGFSTMSSSATLPVTMQCVEKNTNNPTLANFVVPATSNVHMVGDGINITLTSLALLSMTGHSMPGLVAFLPYVAAYVLTKFSGSGVPGGGMIILLPVVEKHLGLTPDLASLVATLYILQDSFMTASNVAGNGALALIANKIFAKKFSSLTSQT